MILFFRTQDERKLWWKVPFVPKESGNLTATIILEQTETIDAPRSVNVYFLGENGLFSSLDFDLISNDYRISLLKKKIVSGKIVSVEFRRKISLLF